MEVANIHVARAWSGGPADVGISSGRSLVELVASSVGQGKAPLALPDAGQFPQQIGDLVDHQIDDLALALDAGLCRDQRGGKDNRLLASKTLVQTTKLALPVSSPRVRNITPFADRSPGHVSVSTLSNNDPFRTCQGACGKILGHLSG